jgi:flagellar motor switch protein FliM
MEILSQKEIDELLTAICAIPGMETKRPNKFSMEQIEAIKNIHETFACLATNSLAAHLRSKCYVHVSSVDELTYDKYIRAMPELSTMATINMNPLKGNAIFGIGPELTFAIIDRVCGGSGDGTKFRHELTDVETSIMDNIIVHTLDNLRSAWNQVFQMCPQVKAINVYPKFVRIVSPNEIVVSVKLEAKIGDTIGMMDICFPCSTIGPLMDKLSEWYWNKSPDNTPSASSAAEEPSEEKIGHIPNENERRNFRSFDYLNSVDDAFLLNFFYNEHPQVIALVMAHMEAAKASYILRFFRDDIQSTVLKRIATMDKVRLEIASKIERILENKFIALSSEDENYSYVGGVESAAKILNAINQYVKEDIIEDIEKEDPELAEEIQKRAGMKEDPNKADT